MSKYKKIEDSVILDELLRALKTNKKKLAEKLGYASHMSVYYVANGRNAITQDMANRILSNYPDVNYSFLIKGEYPILKSNNKPDTFKELESNHKKSITLNDLESIPKRLFNIESKQDQIIAYLEQLIELNKNSGH